MFGNEGHDPHFLATSRTRQRVNFKYAPITKLNGAIDALDRDKNKVAINKLSDFSPHKTPGTLQVTNQRMRFVLS